MLVPVRRRMERFSESVRNQSANQLIRLQLWKYVKWDIFYNIHSFSSSNKLRVTNFCGNFSKFDVSSQKSSNLYHVSVYEENDSKANSALLKL